MREGSHERFVMNHEYQNPAWRQHNVLIISLVMIRDQSVSCSCYFELILNEKLIMSNGFQ